MFIQVFVKFDAQIKVINLEMNLISTNHKYMMVYFIGMLVTTFVVVVVH